MHSHSDLPGSPITISQPGSYRPMGNLVVPILGQTAVLVTGPGVTQDLNGFEIRGHGVNVSLATDGPASVGIENGSIRGFAGAANAAFD